MGLCWSSYYLLQESDLDAYNLKKIGPNRHPTNHWDQSALATPSTTNCARVIAVRPIWAALAKNAVCWRIVRTIVKFWKVSFNLNINHNWIFAVLIFYIQIYHQIYVQQSITIVRTMNISYYTNLKVLGCGKFVELSVEFSVEYLNFSLWHDFIINNYSTGIYCCSTVCS